jgi:hypothetical protein
MKRALVLLLAVAAPALADQVYVKGGGVLTGVIVSRDERSIVLEVAPGRISLPMSRVERVVEGASSLAGYRNRAAGLAASDLNGWLGLAQWAADQGLRTQAQEAFARVLVLDPSNGTAHRALGEVEFGGRWMSPEESYRAQGLVPFEGEWLTPSERANMIRERADAAVAASARNEAEARAREAEARARQAEADAHRAETSEPTDSSGFPYPWIFGGGSVGCRSGCGSHVRPTPRPAATPAPKPEPRPRPASLR